MRPVHNVIIVTLGYCNPHIIHSVKNPPYIHSVCIGHHGQRHLWRPLRRRLLGARTRLRALDVKHA